VVIITWLIQLHGQGEIAFTYAAGIGSAEEHRRCDVLGANWQELQGTVTMAVGVTDSNQQQSIVRGRVQRWAALAVELWRVACTVTHACGWFTSCLLYVT